MPDCYFAASTGGFYNSGVNASWPDDAVKLPKTLYAELALAPRPAGAVMVVRASDGVPVLSTPPTACSRWDGEGWVQDDGLAERQLAEAKDTQCQRLDEHAAEIYSRWTRFDLEYRAREAAAQAFKDAGYLGEPGLYISGFAEQAGVSAHDAADAILAKAAAMRAAQVTLAALRMRKYEIERAVDAGAALHLADRIVEAMNEVERSLA